ncbi:hypothetical protein F4678DRAFT_340691 [Xylaria arbuscula]|nr:hypothetical protein F4678DRAFT_340691 [Xylaria arbuscula]
MRYTLTNSTKATAAAISAIVERLPASIVAKTKSPSMRTSVISDGDSNATNHLDDIEEYGRDKSQSDPESDSELGSSSDEDEDTRKKNETKDTFDQIIADLKACKGKRKNDIKSGDYHLNDSAQLSEFLSKHESILSKKCTKDMNLLHYIAEEDRHVMPSPEKIKAFIEALVKLKVDLLAKSDKNGKTPLFAAISNRNFKLAKVMCEAHSDVPRILNTPKDPTNPKSTNCVHEAIIKRKKSSNDDTINFLIKQASDDTLIALNERGLTPLHLAVEYARCDEGQVKIVETLVGKCDRVLDQTYEHPQKGSLSPYLYLEHTYEEALKKEKSEAENKRRSNKISSKEEKFKGSYGSNDQRERVETSMEEWKLQTSERPRIAQEPGGAPVGKFSSQPNVIIKNQTVHVVGTGVVNSNKNNMDSPADKDRNRNQWPKDETSSESKPRKASVKDMKSFLRLYCLRNRQHDDAVEFLYGFRQDKQIYFDLTGTTSKITKDRIEIGLSYLNFEDILQYVAIPRLEVEYDSIKPRTDPRAAKSNSSGSKDMLLLFSWLRNTKGVKRILKVIVEDLHSPAHSDETIESCLEGMCVEIWDWKKIDLSPDVLHKVAPDVQVAHLYWSGNNSILRAWSEVEGLKKLLKLKTVHLHWQQGLETRDRTKNNITEFITRMEPIQVKEVKMEGSKAEVTSDLLATIHDPYEKHKWITTMEEYADFLQTAEREQKKDIRDPSLLRDPIIVALIDDGVDGNDPAIHSRIIGGRSFCTRDKEQNLNQSFYVSGGGHGTAMAKLICKVCPDVKLFILRLDEYYVEPGKREITAKSAAKAIREAIERGVNIISMSWTIQKTDRNQSDVAKLGNAISIAASKNILMFCAATDQGALRDTTYPAACSTKEIFKIGAAEASGAALKSLGDQSFIDFTLPGHQVFIGDDDAKVNNCPRLTGSSVATALASGLAAVILYTVQLAEVHRRSNDLQAFRSLKNYGRMHEAFTQIGTSRESKFKYITVWNRFERVIKPAVNQVKPRDEWIDFVCELADELMRKP